MRSVFTDPDKKAPAKTNKTIQILGDYGEILKKARTDQKLNQVSVATAAGTTHRILRNIETGGNFQMVTYMRICEALGVTPKMTLLRKAGRKISNPE